MAAMAPVPTTILSLVMHHVKVALRQHLCFIMNIGAKYNEQPHPQAVVPRLCVVNFRLDTII